MLTPLDIENREFKRTMGGYNKEDVEDFMGILLNDYEKLYKENFDLRNLLNNMNEELKELKKNQDSLNHAFVSAQASADSLVKSANEQAEKIVRTATEKANSIIAEANVEIERLSACYLESRNRVVEYKEQMEVFLKSQLDMLYKILGDEPNEESVPEKTTRMEMKTE